MDPIVCFFLGRSLVSESCGVLLLEYLPSTLYLPASALGCTPKSRLWSQRYEDLAIAVGQPQRKQRPSRRISTVHKRHLRAGAAILPRPLRHAHKVLCTLYSRAMPPRDTDQTSKSREFGPRVTVPKAASQLIPIGRSLNVSRRRHATPRNATALPS